MKLDILAFGAHPDDVELSCSGTLLSLIAAGKTAGIADLTKGELGTRGTIATRKQEAETASRILGIKVRENLGFRDGFFVKDEKHLLAVIRIIRKYRPDIVLLPAEFDRHVDHGRAADLLHEACFLSGLAKIKTIENKKPQLAWRPRAAYHYIQDYYTQPHLLVDITPWFETKMSSVLAYGTQFYQPGAKGPVTPISTREYLDYLKSRAMHFGRLIGVTYAEGFTMKRPPGTRNLLDIL